MRTGLLLAGSAAFAVLACRKQPPPGASAYASVDASRERAHVERTTPGEFVGFDRNDYPGDDRLAELHEHFAFAGFWLNTPPGERANSWAGKRQKLRDAGFGFLTLWNGRLDAEILRLQKMGGAPASLGQRDAAAAVEAARREGFPAGTILFLDQEEGGRLLPEQAAYFFAWTEQVGASAYQPGAYLSGQPSPDGTGPDGVKLTITTAEDVREQIAARHLQSCGLLGGPGCVSSGPRLCDKGAQTQGQWNPGRAGVAVRAVASASGPDPQLRGHLCGGWKLLWRCFKGFVSGSERGSLGRSLAWSLRSSEDVVCRSGFESLSWEECRCQRSIPSPSQEPTTSATSSKNLDCQNA